MRGCGSMNISGKTASFNSCLKRCLGRKLSFLVEKKRMFLILLCIKKIQLAVHIHYTINLFVSQNMRFV